MPPPPLPDPSSDESEITPGGSTVYRHKRRVPTDIAFGDEELISAISDHIAAHVGTPDTVFHEIISDLVHIDVHMVLPTPQRPYNLLITSGMSEAPMSTPEGHTGPRYAELYAVLPKDWRPPEIGKSTGKSSADEAATELLYWPIRWLKMLARLPHEYDTFLDEGHTIPNGDPPEPFHSSVQFSCMMVRKTDWLGEGFQTLRAGSREIHFLQMVPLYPEETNLKLNSGTTDLEQRFEACKIAPQDFFNAKRPNAAARRKFLGLF